MNARPSAISSAAAAAGRRRHFFLAELLFADSGADFFAGFPGRERYLVGHREGDSPVCGEHGERRWGDRFVLAGLRLHETWPRSLRSPYD